MFVSMDENLGAVVECCRPVDVGGAMLNHWSRAKIYHYLTE